MKEFELKAKMREELSKSSTRRLRKEDRIPCVMYSKDKNHHFHVYTNDITKLIYTPNAYIISLDVDGTEFKAVMKEVQFHPVTDKILHMDFMEVIKGEPFIMDVPVKMEGFAKGVKDGGKLNLKRRKLRVKGLIKDFPDFININVEDIGLGEGITVSDLELENLEVLEPPTVMVADVKLTRMARGLEEVPEAGEALEGEEAEAAEEAAEGAEGAEATAEGGEDAEKKE